jgi:hypothetical protein
MKYGKCIKITSIQVGFKEIQIVCVAIETTDGSIAMTLQWADGHLFFKFHAHPKL